MKFIVVYEQAPHNWGAYVPDLPGCVATGETKEETRRLIREAIVFHLEGMLEDNEPIPTPGTWAEELEIEVPAPPVRGT
jgi:predicted RNase H-like HicB family nuclease